MFNGAPTITPTRLAKSPVPYGALRMLSYQPQVLMHVTRYRDQRTTSSWVTNNWVDLLYIPNRLREVQKWVHTKSDGFRWPHHFLRNIHLPHGGESGHVRNNIRKDGVSKQQGNRLREYCYTRGHVYRMRNNWNIVSSIATAMWAQQHVPANYGLDMSVSTIAQKYMA